MKKTFTTMLVDDEPASTDLLNIMLSEIQVISVIAIENDAKIAVKKILDLKPDILFLDIEMPGLSGFDVLRIVQKANLYPKVIFTTAYQQYAIKAIKYMALDYLLKPIDSDELRVAIKKLKISQNFQSRLNIPELRLIEPLSAREEEVLKLIIEGFTSDEISKILSLCKSTVDSHRKNLLYKTQARNTAELVVWGALEYFF